MFSGKPFELAIIAAVGTFLQAYCNNRTVKELRNNSISRWAEIVYFITAAENM